MVTLVIDIERHHHALASCILLEEALNIINQQSYIWMFDIAGLRNVLRHILKVHRF